MGSRPAPLRERLNPTVSSAKKKLIMKRGVWILCSVALCLGGCSSTIHKRFSIDEAPPSSLSLDAKQRLFLVTDKGGRKGENKRVVCAEPRPDAVMGIAASGALKAAMADKGSAKIAASLAEAIGELGDRIPTIQLLRDALYRACEAYLNEYLTRALIGKYCMPIMSL
jgi:hypothetical protein